MFSKPDKDLKKLFKLQETLGHHTIKTKRKAKAKVEAAPQETPETPEVTPPPPKPRKPRMTLDQLAEEYGSLRRRVINAIANNYILDVVGRETYKRTTSAYAIVGKYKVVSAFIDWDRELKDISIKPAGLERNKALKSLCKRLGG